MHHLFSLVLNVKDLSKAGELFNIPDRLIMNDISEILGRVREITALVGYTQNVNDQSVMEIVVSRITATIRATNCIEDHIDALVDLLKACLNHDLKPLRKDTTTELYNEITDPTDPPHAKISSDVLASIFLNYTKRSVMKQSIPVAVKFLHKGNRELTRSVSSYLPLAAIEHPDLVAEHIQPIIDSVIGGNYSLAKILPQIYSLNPERVNEHLMALSNILSHSEFGEKSCLLNLMKMVASDNSTVTVPLLEPALPQLLDCLNGSETINPALCVLHQMASESRLLQDHLETISGRVSRNNVPKSALISGAKLFGEIGRHSTIEKSAQCLNKMLLLLQLSSQDPSSQIQILREIVVFSQSRPTVMNSGLINKIQRYLTTSRGLSGVRQNLLDKLWDVCSHRNITVVNIRDNDQISSTTGASSSTEMLLDKPFNNPSVLGLGSLNSPQSPYMFPNVSSGTGHLVSKVHVTNPTSKHNQYRGVVGTNSVLNVTPRLHVSPIKPQNTSGLRHAYGSQPSNTILQQYQSGSGSSGNTGYYKSLNRLPAAGITGEYKKRTALVSPYQNRSICSSIGLQDEFPTSGGLKSMRNSQNSVTIGNSSIIHPTNPYSSATQNHNVLENNISNSMYSMHPQQNLLKNYFSANSGTLSSSASIHHAMTNNYGSRSHTHLASAHQVPVTSTVMGSKGLPSPSRATPQDMGMSANHPYHFSQPELRHNNSANDSNHSNQHENSHRISVFEPIPMRDTILHFCEKHMDKIKAYMEKVCVRMPLPVKCTIEERKNKKSAKLHFSCQCRTSHCLYVSNRLFTMKTRHPRIWIHLMFLALQGRSPQALSYRDSLLTSLKNCWDTLKPDSKSFLAIVTSAFPSTRDQDLLSSELRNAGFFDLFEFNALKSNWGCFFCNYPTRALEFLSSEEPILEGCLKEKKGKWRMFKRWRTRYFTLSGGQLQAKGTDSSSTLNLHQILSLRVTRGQRSIPKAFEIFTEEKKIVLKPKDGKNASEWVQCLSVLVAQKAAEQREENMEASMYSGHYPLGGKGNSSSMTALRTEV